jgi:alanyl-tRNA synthetase
MITIDELLAKAEDIKGIKVASKIVTNSEKEDFEDLAALGRKAHDREKVILLLGCDFEGAKLILARSMDLDVNCAGLAREAGVFIGGGGGGKPEFAQAGGKDSKGLEKAVAELKKKIKELL